MRCKAIVFGLLIIACANALGLNQTSCYASLSVAPGGGSVYPQWAIGTSEFVDGDFTTAEGVVGAAQAYVSKRFPNFFGPICGRNGNWRLGRFQGSYMENSYVAVDTWDVLQDVDLAALSNGEQPCSRIPKK